MSRSPLNKFVRFSGVGIPAFLIDYLLLMWLSQAWGMNTVLAGTISFVVSMIFNYVASMKFVYTHRDDLSRQREFVMFAVLATIGCGINALVIWAGKCLVGTAPFELTATKLVSACIVTVWNFFSRLHWLDADQRQ